MAFREPTAEEVVADAAARKDLGQGGGMADERVGNEGHADILYAEVVLGVAQALEVLANNRFS